MEFLGDNFIFFYSSLYLAVTCSASALPAVLVDGVTDLFPNTAQCLVSCGTCFAAVTEAIWTNFPQLRVRSGPSDPEVDSGFYMPFTSGSHVRCLFASGAQVFLVFPGETTAGFLRLQRLRLHSGHTLPRLSTVLYAGFHACLREAVFEVDSCFALQRHTWKPWSFYEPGVWHPLVRCWPRPRS